MLRRSLSRWSSATAAAAVAAVSGTFRRCDGNIQPRPGIQMSKRHLLDIHQIGNKEATEKERARLSDELSRGYFADISEIRKNGGKIAVANKIIIPSIAAIKFPDLEVNSSDGRRIKLPICYEQNSADAREVDVCLLCLSFRASSQAMTESWSAPFLDVFRASGKIKVYEVSQIDYWLISRPWVRRIFLKLMKNSNDPQREIVYSFGDHYDLRKKLQILNLLTGYIFLLDRCGRIRWQGFGFSAPEEVSSLLTCTNLLLDEKS